jgi:hypothetical protein
VPVSAVASGCASAIGKPVRRLSRTLHPVIVYRLGFLGSVDGVEVQYPPAFNHIDASTGAAVLENSDKKLIVIGFYGCVEE